MAQVVPFRVSNPKRSRVLNVKQSKGGCVTCKTRRVKCDESKPICQRCERADRVCEYRPKRAVSTLCTTSMPSSNPALSYMLKLGPTYEDLPLYEVAPSPAYALSDGVGRSVEQSRLATLGCWILGNDPMSDKFAVPDSSVWIHLLPQLVHSSPTAYASAAAFGAAYESCLISKDNGTSKNLASKLYSKALTAMHEGLTDMSLGTAPVLLSCILLACVEVVQRRRGNALQHLEGAFKVLEISDNASLSLTPPTTTATPSTEDSSSSETTYSSISPKKDDLFLLLRSLDLHTSTYTLSRKPSLPTRPARTFPPSLFPAISNDTTAFDFTSVRGADVSLIIILHNLHHFTSFATTMKYLPPGQIPREASISQGRHLAQLSLWLSCLDLNVLLKSDSLHPTHRHALMLRAQCLTAQIYASTILSPHEIAYDVHGPSFREIVEIADVVIDARVESTIQFRPGLGIIQPLLFTALKYRHGVWRRRAIGLLLRAGIEGPWVGRVEGAVARRVVEVEEEAMNLDEIAGGEVTPEMLPERSRVCGTTLLHDHFADKEAGEGDCLRVGFGRCVDVEEMIKGGKEGFESKKHWNVWEEDVWVV